VGEVPEGKKELLRSRFANNIDEVTEKKLHEEFTKNLFNLIFYYDPKVLRAYSTYIKPPADPVILFWTPEPRSVKLNLTTRPIWASSNTVNEVRRRSHSIIWTTLKEVVIFVTVPLSHSCLWTDSHPA